MDLGFWHPSCPGLPFDFTYCDIGSVVHITFVILLSSTNICSASSFWVLDYFSASLREHFVILVCTNLEALPALSPEHLKYRKIVAELQRYDDPDSMADDEETDAAMSRLQEQAHELETEIWAKPAKALA